MSQGCHHRPCVEVSGEVACGHRVALGVTGISSAHPLPP